MCATARDILANDRGVGVAAAIFFILIMATLGYLSMALTIEDINGAAALADAELALMVAQAGLEFGTAKRIDDWAWTGVAAPGRTVGRGSFTVEVDTDDENGTPLPAGRVMVKSTGSVGTAIRSLRRFVDPAGGGSSATVYATAEGDAVNIQSQKTFIGIANMHDSGSGPNGAWGHGGFGESDNESGDFTGFGDTGLSGTILSVEAGIYGYVNTALDNDDTDLRVYLNDSAQGSAVKIMETELNTQIGSGNAGWWFKDVTPARTWSLADFTGDLELYVLNNKQQGADDGVELYIDAVAFRVTMTSGSGGEVAGSFREIPL